jgi:hypothetical protein
MMLVYASLFAQQNGGGWSGGALRGALIGGAVGAVVGIVIWIVRKGQGGDKS